MKEKESVSIKFETMECCEKKIKLNATHFPAAMEGILTHD